MEPQSPEVALPDSQSIQKLIDSNKCDRSANLGKAFRRYKVIKRRELMDQGLNCIDARAKLCEEWKLLSNLEKRKYLPELID